ncbi:MAG: type II secretion system protein GspJ [bacterium]
MSRRTTRRRTAFTLIELLVATAISALLIVAVFAIYHTVSSTFETVENDRLVFDQAVVAVETAGRDLTCSARIPLSGNIYIVLDQGSQSDDLNSDLSFHTATHTTTPDDTDQFQIERIRYSLQPVNQGTESTKALIRTTQIMAVDGTLGEQVQNDIARYVESFHVTLFDGDKWYDTWPATDGKRPIPSAARITLSCRNGRSVKTFESTVVIRSGLPL